MSSVTELTPAQIAKAALRRLALAKQEPTPENYAQAWAEESGGKVASAALPARAKPVIDKLVQRLTDDPAQRTELQQAVLQGQWDQAMHLVERSGGSLSAQSQAWAQMIERLARGLERGGKQWTLARKKDSLQRVLDSSRSDMQRLQHRLKQLMSNWDSDGEAATTGDKSLDAELNATAAAAPAAPAEAARLLHWPAVVTPLAGTVGAALPPDAPRAAALADELAALAQRLATEGASAELARQVADVCERARRLLSHRHHLLNETYQLSRELAGSLAELAEDDSWVQGQLESLRERLGESPSSRAVHAASELLASTRQRQGALRGDRDQARDALKSLIHQMLSELGELDQHTGRFSDSMQRYADTIDQADSLESLAGVVHEMVSESRSVHALVHATRERLQDGHSRASELEAQVRTLEGELRRMSDEASTDALTQVANRRGLAQLFSVEQARLQREDKPLSVGLLDIDNFKRLNDQLGHAAGDQALVALAQRVRDSLRPGDVVARFGGEEFVVLLPATPVDEAQQVLTRLQRLLSASLFMHEGKEVFVTFSAGVTIYRGADTLEETLERADEALYEAKRTGKNRTCIG
ncbi:diguanylate cyclase [Ideonella azotifigens]|uniref:diguanylate cyclase n=2 Tax=Ideonella azotifigens TaxID=513160 RepID=A0ABN1K6Q0_9BURK|nr:diguanylate cyclase [Ideonella azotifigens]MCD2342151.1 diguanylate cyclase [Ideonella azotifigens]